MAISWASLCGITSLPFGFVSNILWEHLFLSVLDEFCEPLFVGTPVSISFGFLLWATFCGNTFFPSVLDEFVSNFLWEHLFPSILDEFYEQLFVGTPFSLQSCMNFVSNFSWEHLFLFSLGFILWTTFRGNTFFPSVLDTFGFILVSFPLFSIFSNDNTPIFFTWPTIFSFL